MMKKVWILATILFSILFSTTAFASTMADKVKESVNVAPEDKRVVGIFMEAPVTFVNNEKVRELVPAKAKEMFSESRFTILPMDDTAMAMQIYKEDNHLETGTPYYTKPLNRKDIQAMAKTLKCNYALFITVANDAPRFSAGLFSFSYKTTVTCNFRVVNVETGEYAIAKQIVKDGQSTAIIGGLPSFDRAYMDALKKAFDEIKLDTTKLK